MSIARVTMRGFHAENGDYWEEVRNISGYCPDLKIGDKRLVYTKQELDDADTLLAKAVSEYMERERERESDRVSAAIDLALQQKWISEKEEEQLRYEYEYEAALAAQEGRDGE